MPQNIFTALTNQTTGNKKINQTAEQLAAKKLNLLQQQAVEYYKAKQPAQCLAALKEAAELGCEESCKRLSLLYRPELGDFSFSYMNEGFCSSFFKGIINPNSIDSNYYQNLLKSFDSASGYFANAYDFLKSRDHNISNLEDTQKLLEILKSGAILGSVECIDYLIKLYEGGLIIKSRLSNTIMNINILKSIPGYEPCLQALIDIAITCRIKHPEAYENAVLYLVDISQETESKTAKKIIARGLKELAELEKQSAPLQQSFVTAKLRVKNPASNRYAFVNQLRLNNNLYQTLEDTANKVENELQYTSCPPSCGIL